MKPILQPLTADEIEFGKKYIFLEMWYNGAFQMKANPIVFVRELPKDYIGRHAIVELKGKTADRYLESFGLIPEKRFHFHRVVAFTLEISLLLLFTRTPFEYLTAIGFSEEDALKELSKKVNGPRSR
jgi:hypothetical protein